ncbi:hypothetical protein [Sphingobium yanoikuyae]|uniref:hypothetical protein n=1 Tax=Sphingobium yanoikuyae TaxID=13690 RepID=UPI0028AB8CE6|nr:hypothetical protein [Sphingobium yanoikuyae]
MIHIGVVPRQDPGITASDVEAWVKVQRSLVERQLAVAAVDQTPAAASSAPSKIIIPPR